VTLPIPQAWLEPLAVGLDEVEDAAAEFGPRVQIVSRLPDHVMSQDIVDSFFRLVAQFQLEATAKGLATRAGRAYSKTGPSPSP
jgi:hypothetical protein